MITKIEENDGTMTVYLEGRMDTSSSGETEMEIKPVYKHISVRGMSQALRDVFDMTGFTDLFDFI